MERQRAPNPLAACARLSQLMFDSLDELHSVLNEPGGYHRQASPSTGTVLGFPTAQRELR